MTDVALRVERIGKRYRIGDRQESHDTLREALAHSIASPFRRLRSAFNGQWPASSRNFIWALRDISFEVSCGEVLGVIGRNGSGKTTLLKILSRITKPTVGRGEVHGRVGSLLEVGTGFHQELTGRENIFLNGAILGMKGAEIRRKFDAIVEFAEIDKFIDTPVKRYSSGMYVRLAFAVAAHLEAEILLVDEVLAVGDAAFQKKCLGKMGGVAKAGRTVLFVSHNMTAVKALCDRAILLHDGRLVEIGSPTPLVNSYLGSGRVSRAEIIWHDRARAPGNELFRLHSVRVLGQDGRVASEIKSCDSFDVEIEYWNLHAGLTLGTTVVVYNQEGVCIFGSLSNRDREWHGRRRPLGLFRSVCHVPGNLLPDGWFSVSVLLWARNYQSIYREDHAVEFTIHEVEGARGDYLGKMDGVVRPLLQWNTEFLATVPSIDSAGSPARESVRE